MSGTFNDPHFRKLLLAFPGEAIKLLYSQYYSSLVHIAKSLTHDAEASEDIVQDTFIHVWLNSKKLAQHHERSIQHYLVRVVRNKSISYFKENLHISKQKIWFMNGYSRNVSQASPEAHVIQLEVTREIRDLIARFPKRERQCLIMKMDEDLSNTQISKRLGISMKSVERGLTSAKKRLRRYLERNK